MLPFVTVEEFNYSQKVQNTPDIGKMTKQMVKEN